MGHEHLVDVQPQISTPGASSTARSLLGHLWSVSFVVCGLGSCFGRSARPQVNLFFLISIAGEIVDIPFTFRISRAGTIQGL